MKSISRLLSVLIPIFVSLAAAAAPLKVVTTTPDLAEVARRIGGDQVSVESLLRGSEDPHYADASPAFIRKVANAEILCSMGLELEVGWLPKVLSRSGNAKIQQGGKGFCEAGRAVTAIDKPSGPVDRSMGDVHPFGNPHYQLSPVALGEAAGEIAGALERTRPERAAFFQENLSRFRKEMTDLHSKISGRLKTAAELSKKQPVLTQYHREFNYFFDAYGLKSLGSIEEKPGVPPSAARLAEIAGQAKKAGVRLALGAEYAPEKHLKRFSDLSGIPAARLPTHVHTSGPHESIEKVQEALAAAIASAIDSTSAAKGK